MWLKPVVNGMFLDGAVLKNSSGAIGSLLARNRLEVKSVFKWSVVCSSVYHDAFLITWDVHIGLGAYDVRASSERKKKEQAKTESYETDVALVVFKLRVKDPWTN